MPAADPIVRAILLRALMALSFSLMAALLKLASTRGVTAPELMFYRSIFALPIVLAWAWAGPGLSSLRPVRPLAHLTRSTIGVASMMLTFQALIMLPLAEATTINFTSPVFATILSWLMLREAVGPQRWAAVLVGFAGVVIVLRPGGSSAAIPLAGGAVGLLAALGSASVTITLRHLQHSEPVMAIVFWFMVASSLVGLALLPFFARPHDAETVALLAAGGLFGGIGQIAMTGSLRVPVASVVPFDYLQLVCALALGWLLFATSPTVNTLVGAALIAAAGLFTVWRERVRLRVPYGGASTPGAG